MRLISQDEMIDVNYDNGSIVIGFISDGSGAVISYYDHSHRDKATVLGKYSSKDKALKVIEMLREQYMRNNALYIDRENNARVIPQNSLFKFPADEEVEV